MLEAHRTHTRRDRRRPPGGQAPFNTAMRGYQSAYGDCITLWQQLVTRWVALEGQTSKCSHSGWRLRDRGVELSFVVLGEAGTVALQEHAQYYCAVEPLDISLHVNHHLGLGFVQL